MCFLDDVYATRLSFKGDKLANQIFVHNTLGSTEIVNKNTNFKYVYSYHKFSK